MGSSSLPRPGPQVGPAASARQNRAPPRLILPPTRPGAGPGGARRGRGTGLNHYHGRGGEGSRVGKCLPGLRVPGAPRRGACLLRAHQPARLGGRAAALSLFPFSSPAPSLHTCPYGRAGAGAPSAEAGRAVPVSGGGRCEGAEREGGRDGQSLASHPRRPALPPTLPRTPPAMSFRPRSPHGGTKSR